MQLIRSAVRFAQHRRLRQVAKALQDPAATQERVLLRLVRRAAATEWGRAHGYASIRSVEEFQRAVRPHTYEEMAPHWHRAFDGARDVAWPGHVRYFTLTSGTTMGASKAMPVTREAIRANVRSGLTLLALIARQAPEAELTRGQTLYFGGCTRLQERGACLQGDASGINALYIPRLASRFRLPERDISDLSDWEAKVGAICTRYMDAPVRCVVGLPSWTLLLFRRLVDLARERRGPGIRSVAEVWPDLRVLVHFGMAFGPYRTQFEELVGRPIAYVDTYSSSEGGLNAIQASQDDPSMQLELDGDVFFEFIPFSEWASPDPPRLTLDQVRTDVPYAVLLTTSSGMWAYQVGDVVRFTSLNPPRILFASRTAIQLNTFGEHVIQEDLDRAMAEAGGSLGFAVRDFTVSTVLPTASDPRGRHLWLVEFEGSAPPLEPLSRLLDGSICRASEDYRSHRIGDFGMTPPEVVPLAPGTFYAWAEEQGKLGGQHKTPRVALSQAMVDRLRALSDESRPPR